MAAQVTKEIRQEGMLVDLSSRGEDNDIQVIVSKDIRDAENERNIYENSWSNSCKDRNTAENPVFSRHVRRT